MGGAIEWSGGEDDPERKWVGERERETTRDELGGGGAPEGANKGGDGEK